MIHNTRHLLTKLQEQGNRQRDKDKDSLINYLELGKKYSR